MNALHKHLTYICILVFAHTQAVEGTTVDVQLAVGDGDCSNTKRLTVDVTGDAYLRTHNQSRVHSATINNQQSTINHEPTTVTVKNLRTVTVLTYFVYLCWVFFFLNFQYFV